MDLMDLALPALVIVLVMLHGLVLKLRTRTPSPSGRAPWHQLFEGPNVPGWRPPDLVVVDVTAEEVGHAVHYIGLLADYALDAEGGLDRLVLAAVARTEGAAAPAAFTRIDGDYLVLRYAQVLSLSVRYVQFGLPPDRNHSKKRGGGASFGDAPMYGPELLAA